MHKRKIDNDFEKVDNFCLQHTFHMEYFWLMARLHNSIACSRPSTLQLLVGCSWQKRCHYHRGMCMDAVFGTHDPLDYMVLFPSCHHIAILGMISPDFRLLYKETEFRNEREKKFYLSTKYRLFEQNSSFAECL